MERIQKERHRRREPEEVVEDLPEPIDETELLKETEAILGKIAVVLSENGSE